MSAIRKAGVEFYPGIGVGVNMSGLAATLTAKYRLRGVLEYTTVNALFTEDIPGTYSIPVTISAAGDYQFVIESSDIGIENLSGDVLVTNVNIDDVKTALDLAQLDITAIKTQVDTLDEASLNSITATVAETQTTLDNIKLLLDDANGDTAGLNSIMDFVTEINNALTGSETSLAVLAGYTDNLELMLEGKAYTDTEGNPVTEADSKGLSETYALIESVKGDTTVVSTLIADMQTAITATINNAHTDIITRIAAVNTIVTANQDHLESSGYGLATLKTSLDELQVSIDSHADDNTNVLDILNHATTGLAAIKTTIMDKLALMDAKLDRIVITSRSKMML